MYICAYVLGRDVKNVFLFLLFLNVLSWNSANIESAILNWTTALSTLTVLYEHHLYLVPTKKRIS